jgi:hypothetical protein
LQTQQIRLTIRQLPSSDPRSPSLARTHSNQPEFGTQLGRQSLHRWQWEFELTCCR